MAGLHRHCQHAWALAAFGTGSMLAALTLPKLLDRWTDHSVLLTAAATIVVFMTLSSIGFVSAPAHFGWPAFLSSWFLLGAAYASLVTPGGRLLRRSADSAHLPELFAAQFSLSHACWLIAYPLAEWVGATWGLAAAFAALAVLTIIGAIATWLVWPVPDAEILSHSHPELPSDHPHLDGYSLGQPHQHAFHIDELHARWPQ